MYNFDQTCQMQFMMFCVLVGLNICQRFLIKIFIKKYCLLFFVKLFVIQQQNIHNITKTLISCSLSYNHQLWFKMILVLCYIECTYAFERFKLITFEIEYLKLMITFQICFNSINHIYSIIKIFYVL